MKQLTKIWSSNHFQSAFALFASAAIALFSFMLLARGMEKEAFGQWTLYLTLLTFFDMVKSGIVQSALVKFASGGNKSEKAVKIASSWLLNIISVLILSAMSLLVLWTGYFTAKGIVWFLIFYPIYSIASMPFYYFVWNNQVHLDFKKVARIRIVNALLFLLFCAYVFTTNAGLNVLVLLHTAAFLLASILAVVWKGTGITSLKRASKSAIQEYLAFGKFHALAFLGSNLLKSSDVFLINWFLGPVFVAVYSVPLRLLEIVEMPIKSIVNVMFPSLSSHDNKGDKVALKNSVEKYLGVLTLAYLPFMAFLWVMADFLVEFVGGQQYASAGSIFKIFLAFGLFLPFDRITGVALDAIGNSKMNFYKVLVMALVNIIGDVIVLHYFGSLEMVAVVTVINVFAGMVFGYYLVKKHIGISLSSVMQQGIYTIKSTFYSLQNRVL